MELPTLSLQHREQLGKGPARRLRQKGLIPVVCYGDGLETMHLMCDPSELATILKGDRGVNSLFQVEIEGGKRFPLAICREFQQHPFKRNLLHADVYVLTQKTWITIKVPVQVVGRSVGEKMGGRLSLAKKELKVLCLPDDIPKSVPVDVTDLRPAGSILVSDLELPGSASPVYRTSFAVVTVTSPITTPVVEETEESEEQAPTTT